MTASRNARRLAAVMFTDMVGYSALVQRDEKLGYRLLEEQRKLVRATLRGYGGREVETIGDAFLVEFGSALLALQCALRVQQACAQRNTAQPAAEPLSLRIALHLGDVERPGRQLYGDTVNIAARLQELSPRGGVALSAQVHHQVANKLALPYQALGVVALKNIQQSIEVYTLDEPAVQSVAPTAITGSIVEGKRRNAPLRLALAAAVVVALGVIGLVLLGKDRPALTADPVGKRSSVAVLPLKNLSAQPEDAYLSSGIQSAVVSGLSQINDLKVIATNSVRRYQPPPEDLRPVGKALGVGNLVAGSVERSGALVHVKLRVVDASSNRERWSKEYEEPFDRTPALGGRLSEEIAKALNATVSDTEKRELDEVPTSNVEAYALYQRAEYQTSQSARSGKENESLLRQAIALDPSFLSPYALLVSNILNNYLFGIDTDTQRLDEARELLKQMQQIDTDASVTRAARAYFFAQILHDDVRAAGEAVAALRRNPGDPQLLAMLGIAMVHREQMDQAIEALTKAHERDPEGIAYLYDLSDAYSLNHDYAHSIPLLDELIRKVPKETGFPDARVYQVFGVSGEVEPFAATLTKLSEEPDLQEPLRQLEKYSLAVVGNRFDEAQAYFAKQPAEIVWEQSYGAMPRGVVEANLLWVRGDTAAARERFRRELPGLKAMALKAGEDTNLHAWLALTLAVTGDRAGAEAEIRSVTNALGYLQPVHRQAFATLIGQTYLVLGEPDEALNQIELMLTRPSYATAAYVRNDHTWQALREHPRFQKLTRAPSVSST